MKKLKSLLALLAAAALVFTLAACDQASGGDDTDYGAAPPANQVGTWETEMDMGFLVMEMTVKIESSGKVTTTSLIDLTTLVQMAALSQNISESAAWAAIQQSGEYDEMGGGGSVQYSASSPWTISSTEVSKYSDMAGDATIVVAGDTMTVTTAEGQVIELTKVS